jgi:translation initiation factor IF-1
LELIDTAYHNANVPRPKLETRGWKQYLDLIPYAVKLLADKYGLSGPNAHWRITKPVVVEADENQTSLAQLLGPLEKKNDHQAAPQQDDQQSLNTLAPPKGYEPSHIGNKRFFVSIPGAGQTEVDAKNIDEIIEQITNKMRRHSVKVRIDHRTEEGAVLSFWHNDVKREKITVREIGK